MSVCYCSNGECMHVCVYVCVRACMNTMPRLCCYRMELWPLSCQHSCVAIGLGVHGSSRRLGDNNPPTFPSSRWESQCPSSAAPITLRQTPRNWTAMGVTQLPAPRGPEEGRRKSRKRGFLLRNMVRGSVCRISESCGQYYPISCDSLTQEMRRLWHRLEVLHLKISNSVLIHALWLLLTVIAHENTHMHAHTHQECFST